MHVRPHIFAIIFESLDRKSTRLNSSHANISYAVFCLKKKNFPSVILTPMGSFLLGNAPNAPAVTKEFQWEFGERLDWTHGRHNLQLGLYITRNHGTDF